MGKKFTLTLHLDQTAEKCAAMRIHDAIYDFSFAGSRGKRSVLRRLEKQVAGTLYPVQLASEDDRYAQELIKNHLLAQSFDAIDRVVRSENMDQVCSWQFVTASGYVACEISIWLTKEDFMYIFVGPAFDAGFVRRIVPEGLGSYIFCAYEMALSASAEERRKSFE